MTVISDNPARQAFYERMVSEGTAPKLAEMLALQMPPGANTDREFFSGIGSLGDQFSGQEILLNQMVNTAKKHGGSPGRNDVYMPQLARFQGDPEAFVPATGGRNHVRRVCERRGWACTGAVEVHGATRDPGPPVRLAEDLVQNKMAELVKKNPSLKNKPKRELREAVIEKHGSKPS